MSLPVNRPDFPTLQQVEKADREQLAKWYRFLPCGETTEQQKIMDRIERAIQDTRRNDA